MEDNIPKFDLPVDFIVGNSITGEILNQYGRFPCKIKAGIFVLCVQGTVHATVNLTEFTIRKNDFITLPPGCFIQIHEVSDDVFCRLFFRIRQPYQLYKDDYELSACHIRQSDHAFAGAYILTLPTGFRLADQCLFHA